MIINILLFDEDIISYLCLDVYYPFCLKYHPRTSACCFCISYVLTRRDMWVYWLTLADTTTHYRFGHVSVPIVPNNSCICDRHQAKKTMFSNNLQDHIGHFWSHDLISNGEFEFICTQRHWKMRGWFVVNTVAVLSDGQQRHGPASLFWFFTDRQVRVYICTYIYIVCVCCV